MSQLFAEECIYGKTYGTTYIYIHIDTAHILLVSVGLAQARPNNVYLYQRQQTRKTQSNLRTSRPCAKRTAGW